ncbi:helix-turn-helix domain-containing protein [Pseudonocardia sp. CA-107938]|uniref:helix-turn-helix domain-containing protein n=1 Tax=Pseudonocardia sp. CA-107938 TaxID=3240021 RepID=UPI003D8E4F9E
MPTPDAVAAAVGRNVRALRQQRRLTIDALAGAAGVSRGTVIQIESGKANPSIATLVALSEALQVGVASIVDAGGDPRVVVRRSTEAPHLWTSDAGSEAILRIGTDPPDLVELWDWTLLPGDAFDGLAHPLGTEEILCVVSGQLEITVGETSTRLAVDDTVMFQAHAAHRYACVGDAPVRFTMVVLQPGDAGIVPPADIAPAEQ